jgi:hypothetical protein
MRGLARERLGYRGIFNRGLLLCALPSLLGFVTLFPVPVAAQFTTGNFAGTVVDQSRAVVPAAEVAVQDENTGFTRTVSTTSDGSFLFSSLPVGTYTLTVRKEGFSTYIQKGIVLSVNQTVSQAVSLSLGATATAVTVSAAAEMVTSQSSQVSQVVGERPIMALPLNGREPQQLVFLSAGTVDVTNNYCLVNCQGGVYPGEQEANVHGGGPGAVNYQLDGGNYNDSYMNTNLPFPNPDAIAEFSVNTDNLSAEYGNSASAVVNIVTKSGTNSVHGDAFEFVRNGDLNARNFFAPTQDTLKRNQYGGTIGGPIIKDKLFYFGTFQATPVRSTAQGEVAFVPTQAERNGDFSAISTPLVDPVTGAAFQGNQVPVGRFSSPAQYFLNYIPLPNGPGQQLTFAGPSITQNDYQWMAKGDYTVGKHHISSRYFWSRFNEPPFINKTDVLAVDGNGNAVTINNLAVNDNFNYSPNLLFNTWFGWGTQTGGSLSGAPFGFPAAGIQVAAPNPPELSMTVGGFFSVGTNHFGIFNRGDWNFREVATWMKGKNQFEFGGEVLRVKNYINNTFSMAGDFEFTNDLSGNNLVDFMLGQASSFSQGGGEFKDMAGTIPGFFAQDNIRASSKLQLIIGVRWDPYIPYQELRGRVVCFQPGAQSTRFPNAPPGMLFGGGGADQGCPKAGSYSDLANFAPRLGFAYRLTSDGKTSLRGGLGTYYIPPMTTEFNAFADAAPFAPRFVLNDVSFVDPYGSAGIPNPFPAQYGPAIPPRDVGFTLPASIRWYFPLDFHESETAAWNLTLERQLGSSWLLRVGYIGNKGTYLSNGSKANRETNPAIYVPGDSTEANTQQRRKYKDYSSIGEYTSDNNSHYEGLQVTVEKRLSRGLQFLADYTWSKTIDDYGYEDPFNREFDYGLSSDDVPHLLRLSATWDLPTAANVHGFARQVINGWALSGIWSWQSGFPFTLYSGVDNSFSGVGSDHADFIGTSLSQAKLSSGRSHGQEIQEWFNTSLFAPNAIGTFGNSGKDNLRGPGYFNVDMALVKNFPIKERTSVQFRAEFFNSLNDVNFALPGTTLGSSSFGQITSASDPRILQFALKLMF